MVYENSTARARQELNDFVNESPTGEGMFIGAELLPEYGLDMSTGHFLRVTIAEGDLMRAARNRRAPGAGFVRSQSGFGDGTVDLVQYGEEISIPDEHQKTFEDYLSLEEFHSAEGRNKLLRLHEILIRDQIQNVGNFDSVNSAVAYTAANKATNSFVDDMHAAFRRLKARGIRPNTIMIPSEVYDRLRGATLVQAFIAGANQPGSVVNSNTIQRAFAENGIEKVLLGDAMVNNSINNDDHEIDEIWTNDLIWVGQVKSGPLQTGGAGRNYFWKKEGPLLNVMTYRDEPKRSNIVRVMTTVQPEITNSRAGTLVATQFA